MTRKGDPATCVVGPDAGGRPRGASITYDDADNRASIEFANRGVAHALDSYAYVPGTNVLDAVTKLGGVDVDYAFDATGSMISVDDADFDGDEQDFFYYASGRTAAIAGFVPVAGAPTTTPATDPTLLGEAFDHRGRRVLKTYTDTVTGVTQVTHFLYDARDELISYTFVPDARAPAVFETHDYVWFAGEPLVEFHRAGATTEYRRFLHTDHLGTVLATTTWPPSGDAGLA